MVCLLLGLFLTKGLAGESELAIDEMGGGKVITSAQNGNKVLLCLIHFPAAELYLFNFESKTFRRIKDGRINPMVYSVMSYDAGFVCFRLSFLGSSALTLLDGEGAFEKSVPLDALKGFRDSMSVHQIMAYRDDLLLASFREDLSSETLLLAEINLGLGTFEPVASYSPKNGFPLPFWASDGKETYFISTFTGFVARVDATTFLPVQTLRPEREMVPLHADKKSDGPSFLNYKPLLADFSLVDGSLRFTEQEHTAKFEEIVLAGKRTRRAVILPHYFSVVKGVVSRQPARVLAEHEGRQLIFDEADGGFSLVPSP